VVEVPGPERIVEVEREVVREVPGPERIVEVQVPGPERIVEIEVAGPEKIIERIVKVPVEVIKEVVREVPGPERVVNKIVNEIVKERIEVPVYTPNPAVDQLLDWAMGANRLNADDSTTARRTTFGIEFPKTANRGDFFLRVDSAPSRLFKYNGEKWIEVSKDQNGSYINNDYVMFLVERLVRGEIDFDQLTPDESEEVRAALEKDQPLKNI
jgi:hypothetical protein